MRWLGPATINSVGRVDIVESRVYDSPPSKTAVVELGLAHQPQVSIPEAQPGMGSLLSWRPRTYRHLLRHEFSLHWAVKESGFPQVQRPVRRCCGSPHCSTRYRYQVILWQRSCCFRPLLAAEAGERFTTAQLGASTFNHCAVRGCKM